MADYAVVDPATGETIKTYPTITDEQLDAAIGRAHAAHTRLEPGHRRSRSARR